ncbi:hypothetical protein MNB_SUP05-5-995 [hydrothermal vent metagenome]|uniref:Uncharacterized protein n=1 Tax=hydrothermal vent metagenome TaxID=652676 RepID=A0A1W1CQT1_9ZZZZ
MKYLNKDDIFDAEGSEDLTKTSEQLQARVDFYEKQLLTLEPESEDYIKCLLEIARLQVEQYEGKKAWDNGFKAFDIAIKKHFWELATESCDVMFLSEGPDALVALGHALWLGITFPIDPELTVAMLQHLIDESPKESETRAVAASVALFIATSRAGKDSDLVLFTNQMLAGVADSHSHITDQGSFDVWRKAMELDNIDILLSKLSGAINQLIKENWWVNKDDIYKIIDNS